MLQNGRRNTGDKENDPLVFLGIEKSYLFYVRRDKHDKVRFSTKNVRKETPAKKEMKLMWLFTRLDRVAVRKEQETELRWLGGLLCWMPKLTKQSIAIDQSTAAAFWSLPKSI